MLFESLNELNSLKQRKNVRIFCEMAVTKPGIVYAVNRATLRILIEFILFCIILIGLAI